MAARRGKHDAVTRRPRLWFEDRTDGEAADLVLCPHCGRFLPREEVGPEVWYEEPIEGGWIAAYRVIPHRGRPIVAEVRVFPDEPGRERPGRWSAERLGVRAPVPQRGLSTQVIRGVRVATALEATAKAMRTSLSDEQLRKVGVYYPASWHQSMARSRVPEMTQGRPKTRGRPTEWSDARLAELGVRYVALNAEGIRNPVETLARARSLSVTRVRDLLARARERGILDRPGRGAAGGNLTRYGRDLVQQTDEGRSE